MEVESRDWRDLEARIMNLEVRDQPVSREDITRRWVAVRETLDEFSIKLGDGELARRGLNDTVTKVLQQNLMILEMLSGQSVQIQDLSSEVHTLSTRLTELEDSDGNLS